MIILSKRFNYFTKWPYRNSQKLRWWYMKNHYYLHWYSTVYVGEYVLLHYETHQFQPNSSLKELILLVLCLKKEGTCNKNTFCETRIGISISKKETIHFKNNILSYYHRIISQLDILKMPNSV